MQFSPTSCHFTFLWSNILLSTLFSNTLSLCKGRPLSLTKIHGTHLCYRLSRPHGHSAAGRIRSIEKSTSLELEPATFRLVAQCPPPLSLCSSLNARDQVSSPYRTTGKVIISYILIFTFLDKTRRQKVLDWIYWIYNKIHKPPYKPRRRRFWRTSSERGNSKLNESRNPQIRVQTYSRSAIQGVGCVYPYSYS
jgi:hypothetical protein